MAGFAFDMARLTAFDAQNRDGELQLLQMPGTLIFTQREKLAEEALEWGADAILYIDSDMRFPADALNVLLSRDVPIIGVNATTRREPVVPTAMNLHLDKMKQEGNVRQVWTKIESRGKVGIEQVTAVGFGVTLIRKEVFEKIPKPWFDVIWTDHGNVIGEDVAFCVKAMEQDIPVYVDHDLSLHIGHIGTKTFGWDDVNYGPRKLQRSSKRNR
jgi:hypothetical protein